MDHVDIRQCTCIVDTRVTFVLEVTGTHKGEYDLYSLAAFWKRQSIKTKHNMLL